MWDCVKDSPDPPPPLFCCRVSVGSASPDFPSVPGDAEGRGAPEPRGDLRRVCDAPALTSRLFYKVLRFIPSPTGPVDPPPSPPNQPHHRSAFVQFNLFSTQLHSARTLPGLRGGLVLTQTSPPPSRTKGRVRPQ